MHRCGRGAFGAKGGCVPRSAQPLPSRYLRSYSESGDFGWGRRPMAGGVGDDFPQFFFSYAHAHWDDPADQREADHWVRKFYVHLNGAIRSLINVPADKNPLFIDRALHIGDHWPDELA